MSPTYAASIDTIREAAERIAPWVHRTPVMTSSTLDDRTGRKVFLKCENLQKIGAFKFRGACNAVMKLSDDEASRGVVTHSSGNHAQAVALAAKLRGIPAHIVMPKTAMRVKRAAVEGYGAEVHACEPTLPAREELAAKVIEKTGGTLIPPYDHADVIAGQGTTALELFEQVPDLDVIVAPISGAGLISGVAVAVNALHPKVRVIAAEPTGANDAALSKEKGELVKKTGKTICDGLVATLGRLTWPIVRDLVDEVLTVDDEAVVATMRLLWERTKLVVEPSGAIGVALAMSRAFEHVEGQRVAIVLSGGNVDLDRLPWS